MQNGRLSHLAIALAVGGAFAVAKALVVVIVKIARL